MTVQVRVNQRDLPAEKRFPVRFLRQVARVTAAEAGCRADAELGLMLTLDPQVHDLNRRYRGIDKPTDVLSFALEEGPAVPLPPGVPRQLGDVVISLDTTRRQAAENGVELASELAWVITHGVLHLLGYDHRTGAQRAAMRALEVRVLSRLGQRREVLV